MTNSLTPIKHRQRVSLVLVFALVTGGILSISSVQAQDKRTFTHMADYRPGHEDAFLDVFKPISEQFDYDYRALGTAYTTGEILYRQKRYDDAARNFQSVITKGGKKYAYLTDASRVRLAQTMISKGDL